MRKAIAAGQFYAQNKEDLKKQIESCFKNKFGPGNLPKKIKNKSNFIALISPHAGYLYSGQCAAHGFKFFAEESLPETIILLGPNHTGNAKSQFSLSFEDFETPLGIVKNNIELGKKLLSNNVQEDEFAHKYEHSIEVQLPFLQYIYKKAKRTETSKVSGAPGISNSRAKQFKIVPIIVSTQNYSDLISLSEAIFDLVKKEKSIGVIASSDFTHYGQNYGFMPFKDNIKKNLYALDKGAIKEILKLNSKEFYNRALKTTICGLGPITVLIELSKRMGVKAHLLKYYTSGDILNDYESAVGYASISFN